MLTVTDRSVLQLSGSRTARFEGTKHSAEVSMFWVRTPHGQGPDYHWHPYTETWVVLHGEVRIEAGGEQFVAKGGNIITVPAETVHRFRSIGEEELEMLCIHASPAIIQEFVTPPDD
ncbi:cupin domain-containing protein [uncultured Agrococcus sp.]|uniref:cupin domain-containing protein n=1 Tax=uncultured Agrococcus sp. TaxID=382258 RepID=UPI0026009082|nr:cupin domain-containing protein [uncultured Agrococcus sp.]